MNQAAIVQAMRTPGVEAALDAIYDAYPELEDDAERFADLLGELLKQAILATAIVIAQNEREGCDAR